MSESVAWIWFGALMALTCAVWGATWPRVPAQARFPWLFYSAVYVLTTGIGATVIGLTNGVALIQVDAEAGWGLDVSLLQGSITPQYWIVLFAPLIAPALLFWLAPPRSKSASVIDGRAPTTEQLTPGGFLAVFGLFAGYCLLSLFRNGYGFSIGMWFQSEGDFVAMMAHRMALGAVLGSLFFGIAYITLPTLAQAAVFQFVRIRSSAWLLFAALSVGIMLFIDLSLMQKSHAMLHLLIITVGMAEMRFLRWKLVALIVGGLFAGLTFLMSLMLDGWDSFQTLRLIVYRMSHAYPYYLTIFPDLESFRGIDLGLHLVGIGSAPDQTWRVFTYMYPGYFEVDGACPAPANVDAYAQAGLMYSIFISFLIGVLVRWSAELRTRIRGPIGFALYMQSLMALYYVSQTSLRESVISCYGIFYAFVAIIPLYAVRSAVSDERRAGVRSPAPVGISQGASRVRSPGAV
jgi:hypothetical protein